MSPTRVAVAVLSMVLFAASALAQDSYELKSPDQRITARVRTQDRIRYDVLLRQETLLRDSSLSIDIERRVLGLQPKVLSVKTRSSDQVLPTVVHQKAAQVREAYNELQLQMDGGYTLTFRAYNEGVAYRLETSLPESQVKVFAEEATFNFPEDYTAFYPEEESFYSHNERLFLPRKLTAIPETAIATLPVVVETANGTKVALAESDIDDYPGLWIRGIARTGLTATFPPYPLKETLEKDRDLRVTEAADYIAVTRGTRTFPWRVIAVAERDADLITNQLVWLLQRPSEIQDTSWIRPGKVAWDWWNANNIAGVDFKAGINTATYKHYIDFASKYGIEYVVLDEGWYKLGNVLEQVPEINVEELTAYARQKNVGIILWVIWKTLDAQLTPALDQYEKWGVKGVKVDFMQRDDQLLVNYLHRVSREAAKRKMLVDFHGVQRSALMTRTWPNLISNEGVRGGEWNKWSTDASPEHNLTLPFTRMFLGPMDYTPGAMRNASKQSFAHIFEQPMSQGTRCHQLAMYVVFESPLQMLADSPTNYLREPEAMEFLSAVPSVWDETRALDGKIGDYVLVARRKGNEWYVGAMTDWTPRELEIDFGFLPEGSFTLDSYQDGINAERFASDYKRTKAAVDRTTKLKIKLAPGGGWVGRVKF